MATADSPDSSSKSGNLPGIRLGDPRLVREIQAARKERGHTWPVAAIAAFTLYLKPDGDIDDAAEGEIPAATLGKFLHRIYQSVPELRGQGSDFIARQVTEDIAALKQGEVPETMRKPPRAQRAGLLSPAVPT